MAGVRGTAAARCRRGALLLALVGVAASGGEAPPGVLERGAEVIAPFRRAMKQALQEGMARGPAEAIAACRVRAPEIARDLSRDGVRVGRTSHRLRNPANVPPEWARPLLAAYVEEPAAEPRAVRREDGGWGYVEPIFTQPLCLNCHGETLAPEVAARIEALYPQDEATGFEAGELRGLFWAELPAEPSPGAARAQTRNTSARSTSK